MYKRIMHKKIRTKSGLSLLFATTLTTILVLLSLAVAQFVIDSSRNSRNVMESTIAYYAEEVGLPKSPSPPRNPPLSIKSSYANCQRTNCDTPCNTVCCPSAQTNQPHTLPHAITPRRPHDPLTDTTSPTLPRARPPYLSLREFFMGQVSMVLARCNQVVHKNFRPVGYLRQCGNPGPRVGVGDLAVPPRRATTVGCPYHPPFRHCQPHPRRATTVGCPTVGRAVRCREHYRP